MKKLWGRLKAIGCLVFLVLGALLYFFPVLRELAFSQALAQQSPERKETTRRFLTSFGVLTSAPSPAPSPEPLLPEATPIPELSATPEPSPEPTPSPTPEPKLTAERTAEAVVIRRGEAEVGRFSTLYKTNMPGGAGPVAVGGPHVWWGTKELLFHGDLATQKTDVFLPYRGAKGEVVALESDDDGVLVTTGAGQKLRIAPDQKQWRGYLRAPLGSETQNPAPQYASLKKSIESWLGVPYLWGGDTKKGTDCSGLICNVFKGIVPTIPRTAKEQARLGIAVTDTLQWGDLLCYDGHVSIYVGNGLAAEALGTKDAGGVVKYATIWHRPCLGARRLLGVSR